LKSTARTTPVVSTNAEQAQDSCPSESSKATLLQSLVEA